jgi:hypothetical protein
MNGATVAIGGIVLIPLIIGLIEFVKRLAPGAPGNVWLVTAMILGIAGQVVVWLIAYDLPAGLEPWAILVVQGLAFGLASSKAYDETIGKP